MIQFLIDNCLITQNFFRMKKPVRLLLERDEDMVITGGRNPFLAKWKVGFDDNGKILALNTEFYANAGYCLDLSEAVIMKAVFNVNNVYKYVYKELFFIALNCQIIIKNLLDFCF